MANADACATGLVRLIGDPWTLVRVIGTSVPALLARHPRRDIRTFQPRSLARGEAALAGAMTEGMLARA